MNTAMITAGQAARAMGLDEKEMAVLLNEKRRMHGKRIAHAG